MRCRPRLPFARRDRHTLRARVARVLVLSILLWPTAASRGVADSRLDEYQVKAGYLYNFAKFVTWPADVHQDATAPFVLCVFGDDPFGPVLDEVVRGRMVGKRSLAVRRPSLLKELSACQILFVGGGTVSSFAEVRQRLQTASVLTVGESDWFTRDGGMIRFTVDEQRVGFEISVPAATRAGLEISSQLLKIATTTNGARRGRP